MTAGEIRIATRASRLALWQANHVAGLLRAIVPDHNVELVHVSTIGDRDRDRSLPQFGGFGVFTREIQNAVLDGRADLAVHSLKDLPTETAEGLMLAAVPARGPVVDALVLPASSAGSGLETLDDAARVGTGSLRRRAQLLHQRRDLELLDIRGNVETRLQKLDDGEYEAIVLAVAGLERLGLQQRISATLDAPLFFPAVGQGALGLECRDDDAPLQSLLAEIDHAPTRCAVTAERALLSELRAGCHAPVGASTNVERNQLTLAGVVLSVDGKLRLTASLTGPATDPHRLGSDVARELKRQGAGELIGPATS